jgi:hypothetical protein
VTDAEIDDGLGKLDAALASCSQAGGTGNDEAQDKRAALAYSGGLDTSIIVPWLKNIRAARWCATAAT